MAEADLYPLLLRWIEAEFPLVRTGNFEASHRLALITANLNWISAGPWTRPDLALVHVFRRRFDPVPQLHLYTFEAKKSAGEALFALHEALAHGRIADFVLVAFPHSDDSQYDAVLDAADRFGVGVVTFGRPEMWSQYDLVRAPRRTDPDLDLRDLFLTAALKDAGRTDEVLDWLGLATNRKPA